MDIEPVYEHCLDFAGGESCLAAVTPCEVGAFESGYRQDCERCHCGKIAPTGFRRLPRRLGGLMVTFFSSPAAQLKEAGISERGIQAVEFALKNGRITNTDVQEMAKVSKPTATRLLTSLSDYLELKGTTGKGTYYTVKGLTKGSRQHCFVLLNTRTCLELEGNPHVHRPCGIRRFRSPSDSQIYYREHQTGSDSLYSGTHIVMILFVHYSEN